MPLTPLAPLIWTVCAPLLSICIIGRFASGLRSTLHVALLSSLSSTSPLAHADDARLSLPFALISFVQRHDSLRSSHLALHVALHFQRLARQSLTQYSYFVLISHHTIELRVIQNRS